MKVVLQDMAAAISLMDSATVEVIRGRDEQLFDILNNALDHMDWVHQCADLNRWLVHGRCVSDELYDRVKGIWANEFISEWLRDQVVDELRKKEARSNWPELRINIEEMLGAWEKWGYSGEFVYYFCCDPPPHDLYTVREGIKIGYSGVLLKRLKIHNNRYGPLSLLAIRPGGHEVEQAIHALLDDYRVRGEWFAVEHELWDYIQCFREGVGIARIDPSCEGNVAWVDKQIAREMGAGIWPFSWILAPSRERHEFEALCCHEFEMLCHYEEELWVGQGKAGIL